jgi:hypothetical protein
MCDELPCIECPVFAICNQRNTEDLFECGILMRYILEDSSDKAQVGIRVEITGDKYKRDLVFDVDEHYSEASVGKLIDTTEYYLVTDKTLDDDHIVHMIHEMISF